MKIEVKIGKKYLLKTLQLLGTKKNTGKMHSNAIGCISDHVPFIYHFGHEMWWIKLTRSLYETQFGGILTIDNKYITKTVDHILFKFCKLKKLLMFYLKSNETHDKNESIDFG